MESTAKDRRRYFFKIGLILLAMSLLLGLISNFFSLPGYISSFIFLAAFNLLLYRYFANFYLGGTNYQRYRGKVREPIFNSNFLRFLILDVVFLVVYFIARPVFAYFGLNKEIAFVATAVIFIITVKVVDFYAGRDMEQYLDHKTSSHNRFVESLTPETRRCQSCNQEIDAEDLVCASCGFKQKRAHVNQSYTD